MYLHSPALFLVHCSSRCLPLHMLQLILFLYRIVLAKLCSPAVQRLFPEYCRQTIRPDTAPVHLLAVIAAFAAVHTSPVPDRPPVCSDGFVHSFREIDSAFAAVRFVRCRQAGLPA